jgi:large-conductance mechanosensitive channel
MTAVTRAVRAFGHFWWDFLVGDTPEVALAVGVIVGLAFLLAGQRVVGAILLPLVATVFLFVSTYRGRRRAPRP